MHRRELVFIEDVQMIPNDPLPRINFIIKLNDIRFKDKISSWGTADKFDHSKHIKNGKVFIQFTGHQNIVQAITAFLKALNNNNKECDIVDRKEEKVTAALKFKRRCERQIARTPKPALQYIDSYNLAGHNDLYRFLDEHSEQQPAFHKNVRYNFPDFSFVLLEHTLIRKPRINKKTGQAKLHPITNKATYTYTVILPTKDEIIGSGASSTVYNAIGRLKPHKSSAENAMGARAYFPYPLLSYNEENGKKKSSKLLKQINLDADHNITSKILSKEQQFMKAVGYLNPSEITYDLATDQGNYAYILMNAVPGIGLEKFKSTSLEVLLQFAVILLQELDNLHKKNIVHKDIKPANIIFNVNEDTSDVYFYFIDFGFSEWLDQVDKVPRFCGTPAFLAPEIAARKTDKFSHKIDIFSLGIVLQNLFHEINFHILTSLTPFEVVLLRYKNFKNRIEPKVKLNSSIKDQFKDKRDYKELCEVLSLMTHSLPDERLELSAALTRIKKIQHNVATPSQATLLSSPSSSSATITSTNTKVNTHSTSQQSISQNNSNNNFVPPPVEKTSRSSSSWEGKRSGFGGASASSSKEDKGNDSSRSIASAVTSKSNGSSSSLQKEKTGFRDWLAQVAKNPWGRAAIGASMFFITTAVITITVTAILFSGGSAGGLLVAGSGFLIGSTLLETFGYMAAIAFPLFVGAAVVSGPFNNNNKTTDRGSYESDSAPKYTTSNDIPNLLGISQKQSRQSLGNPENATTSSAIAGPTHKTTMPTNSISTICNRLGTSPERSRQLCDKPESKNANSSIGSTGIESKKSTSNSTPDVPTRHKKLSQ